MPRRAPVLRTGAQVPAARRRQASCLDQESNLGRAALRAAALPAELSRRVEQAGFEPAAPWSRTTCATGCATARRTVGWPAGIAPASRGSRPRALLLSYGHRANGGTRTHAVLAEPVYETGAVATEPRWHNRRGGIRTHDLRLMRPPTTTGSSTLLERGRRDSNPHPSA